MISIIIVLYNYSQLSLCAFEELQNAKVIIVDNTPNQDLALAGYNLVYIPLMINLGIATAQNIGISKAIELKSEYILFFDQDSIINESYINNILSEYIKLEKSTKKHPILGPSIINNRSGVEYKELQGNDINNCIRVSSVISSGSIMNAKIFDEVGMMNSNLFIDYVDFEFCWRAINKGHEVYRSKNIKMAHSVGESDMSLFGFPIITSAPIRYFYQYRNFIWLLGVSYVPSSWKLKGLVKKLVLIFVYLCKGEFKIVRNMIQGMKQGMKQGIIGKSEFNEYKI